MGELAQLHRSNQKERKTWHFSYAPKKNMIHTRVAIIDTACEEGHKSKQMYFPEGQWMFYVAQQSQHIKFEFSVKRDNILYSCCMWSQILINMRSPYKWTQLRRLCEAIGARWSSLGTRWTADTTHARADSVQVKHLPRGSQCSQWQSVSPVPLPPSSCLLFSGADRQISTRAHTRTHDCSA